MRDEMKDEHRKSSQLSLNSPLRVGSKSNTIINENEMNCCESSFGGEGNSELVDSETFNVYNTDIVKFDARSATMTTSGDLVRQNDELERENLEQFALVDPDYELADNLAPKQNDSVTNKSFTDVTFIVGPPQHSKKYVGHRVLLAMTSPVFETMFYGDMADKSKYIRIVDVAPIGFENLLRYAYTDSLNLNSVEDAMLTAYAAKKYLLPQLLRECLTHIEHNIGPSTACVVFEFAHVLNSQQLVLQAMNLIDRQTLGVITSKTFAQVQGSTVEFLANRRYLTLNTEFTLFNAIINWAHAEVRRRQLMDPNDWQAIRSILSDDNSILNAIRFLAMSQEEFARAVARTSSTVQALPMMSDSVNSNDFNQSTLATEGSLDSISCSGGNLASNAPATASSSSLLANQQDSSSSMANEQVNSPKFIEKINPDDPNSLLTDTEQRAIFLNLALGQDCAKLPKSICSQSKQRQAPPEYFTLKRFKSSSPNLIVNTTTTRSIKSISSKFQCLSENVFIVGLTIPIRLDASSYANRTPKFECHLKFTTRTTSSSSAAGAAAALAASAGGMSASGQNNHNPVNELANNVQQQDSSGMPNGTTLLMDTIDESLHISIARDKDCLVRLKRPILIRMGNLNELTLTFQTYALDEDIVALRTPKLRSANFSEQTDGENISWLFFKSSNIEFSELHYYF